MRREEGQGVWEECRRKMKNTHTKGFRWLTWAIDTREEGDKHPQRMEWKETQAKVGAPSFREPPDEAFVYPGGVMDEVEWSRLAKSAVKSELEKWGHFWFPLYAPTTGYHSSRGCHEDPASVGRTLETIFHLHLRGSLMPEQFKVQLTRYCGKWL